MNNKLFDLIEQKSGLKLFDAQKDIINKIIKNRFCNFRTCRQFGVSQVIIKFLKEYFELQNERVAVLSKDRRNSKISPKGINDSCIIFVDAYNDNVDFSEFAIYKKVIFFNCFLEKYPHKTYKYTYKKNEILTEERIKEFRKFLTPESFAKEYELREKKSKTISKTIRFEEEILKKLIEKSENDKVYNISFVIRDILHQYFF